MAMNPAASISMSIGGSSLGIGMGNCTMFRCGVSQRVRIFLPMVSPLRVPFTNPVTANHNCHSSCVSRHPLNS